MIEEFPQKEELTQRQSKWKQLLDALNPQRLTHTNTFARILLSFHRTFGQIWPEDRAVQA